MIENIYYTITLANDLKDKVYLDEQVLVGKGEQIKISEAQYKTMCANGYIYLSFNIEQGVNIGLKIMLSDIGVLEKFTTSREVIPKNPEIEYPD